MFHNNKIIHYQNLVLLLLILAIFAFWHSVGFSLQTTQTLALQLQEIVSSTNLNGGELGVYIVEADSGRLLYDYNSTKPLIPASCNKLLTTSSALYYLGSAFSYKTQIYYTGGIKDGVLNGNIVVVGSGDPTISGRFHPQGKEKDHLWVFRQWAEGLKKRGVRIIYGDIIGDDDFFDDECCGKGWPAAERAEWYCAEVSALSFNDNCIDIQWQGAKKTGLLALFKLNPPTDYVTLINAVNTGDKNSGSSINYSREDKSNMIRAEGTIPVEKESYDWATIYNPTLYFATVLKETLEKNGIVIKGKAIDIDDLKDKTPYRQGLQLVDAYVSPPFSDIIKVINRRSQNFYAEQLLKTIGKIAKDEGSFLKGGEAIIEFLEKEKIYESGTIVVDGSGLSRFNRLSASQLVKVLQFMAKHPEAKIFFDSLPQGGASGTLKKRFQDTPQSREAASRIRGKTGHLGGVSSLAGILETKQGQKVYYSIIINAPDVSTDTRRKLIDNIVLTIASRDYI